MEELEVPKLVDAISGEILKTNQLKENTVYSVFAQMSDPLLSNYLSQINFTKRIVEKLEKFAKEYIKHTKNLEFDENGKSNFQEWKISKIKMRRFSEDLLLKNGTTEEIEIYQKIKEKYTSEQEIIKFG